MGWGSKEGEGEAGAGYWWAGVGVADRADHDGVVAESGVIVEDQAVWSGERVGAGVAGVDIDFVNVCVCTEWEPQMGDGSLTPGDHVEERDTEEGDGEAEREEGTGDSGK